MVLKSAKPLFYIIPWIGMKLNKQQQKNNTPPPLFGSTSKENTHHVFMRKEKKKNPKNSVRKNLPAHILYQFFVLDHGKCGIPDIKGNE